MDVIQPLTSALLTAAAFQWANPDGSTWNSGDYNYTLTPVVTVRPDGADVAITVLNDTAKWVRRPRLRIPIPWDATTSGPLLRMWAAKGRWRPLRSPYKTGVSSDGWMFVRTGNSPLNRGGAVGSACIALDNGLDTTIGISFDYDREVWVHAEPTMASGVSGYSHAMEFSATSLLPSTDIAFGDPGGPNPEEVMGPGEQYTLTVSYRIVNRAGWEASLDSVLPYTERMAASYPRLPGTDDSQIPWPGRVYGLLLADSAGSAANRYYRSFNGSRPDQVDDWRELLDNIVVAQFGSLATMQARHVTHFLFWACAGYANDGNDFRPNVIGALPLNLANSLTGENSPAAWTAQHGPGVLIYQGRAVGTFVAKEGAWDDVPQLAQISGRYSNHASGGDVLPSISDDPPDDVELDPEFAPYFAEEHQIIATSFDGIMLDAVPEPARYPWVIPYLEDLRTYFQESFGARTEDETITAAWCGHIGFELPRSDLIYRYGNNYNFTGICYGRCHLIDRMYPTHQDLVQISVGGLTTAQQRGVLRNAERAGYVPIEVGAGVGGSLFSEEPVASNRFAHELGDDATTRQLLSFQSSEAFRVFDIPGPAPSGGLGGMPGRYERAGRVARRGPW